MRELLRSLPVFAGPGREFETDDLPPAPEELFARWLADAIDSGVVEPHAMTLSTVDAALTPDARVLILKDLDERGWWFASSAKSAKGLQLAANPAAALTFYWPQVARRVRVRGLVTPGSAELNAADFASRGVGAKAVALASRESQPLAARDTCAQAVALARRRLDERPDLVSSSWSTYVLAANTVEFWQADLDRQHVRVRFSRDVSITTWTQTLLWP